jgi:hypothetical protein
MKKIRSWGLAVEWEHSNEDVEYRVIRARRYG